ncbi:hypothetical protein BIV57_08630 [Mangrovactinospora gilvigrisea]|uniref:DNA primase/polymerase bifunctional N-terminal domain-containing protein n=1 Tax=Mangrovactinospora gilvigrisea TaxID=1428644 RepID=A0A1J7BGV4_9ACTN|nr:hypothetical protein [Mangrovactinospora gilvigrisea]OIV37911.1 hypothetical protein BIV57_08630 [Mangrovactinospora gilvigrisea]
MTYLPDQTKGTSWLMSASEQPGLILADWAGDGRSQLPAGRLFDVVGLSNSVGTEAIEQLQRAGAAVGPVLESSPGGELKFLVPPGTAKRWLEFDVPASSVASHGDVLECPMPGATRWGRTWLYPPDGSGTLTDVDALRVAVVGKRAKAS